MAEHPPIVAASDLSKGYGDRVVTWALRGVHFCVDPGEFVVIVGVSGSGKSTLLNLLGALDTPTSGRVYIDGQDTSRLDETGLAALRGEKIGFVFQFHHLLSEFTILENAMMPLMIRRRGITLDDLRWVRRMFARFGLDHRLHCRPSQLSGGQQQKAAIVRALAARPRLILADEPTGNLDSKSGTIVLDFLTELNSQFGMAVVLVTHDDRLAQRAERIVLMEDGRIAAEYKAASANESSIS